jgi:hypothetical protein
MSKDYVKIVNLDGDSGTCDWEKAKDAGIGGMIFEYVFFSVSQVREAVKHGIPIGYIINKVQAKAFTEDFCDNEIPFNLDVWLNVKNSDDTPGNIKRAAELLSSYYPGRVGIRTSKNWWESYMTSDPYWSTLKLWVEQWDNGADAPDKLRDWESWTLWQYSADGNGKASVYGFSDGNPDIGLNYYNGTFQDLQREYLLDPFMALENRVKMLELELKKAVNKAEGKAIKSMPKVLEEMTARFDKYEHDIDVRIAEIEDWIGAFRRGA